MKIQVYVSTKAQVHLRMNTYLEKLSLTLWVLSLRKK